MLWYNWSNILFLSRRQRKPGSDKTKKSRDVLQQQQLVITKNLFLVLVTYLVCISPHILCEIADAPYYVILHTRMLVACNSCLNPILYGVKHPHFRQVFKCVLLRRWEDIPQPAFRWMAISQDTDSDLKSSTYQSVNAVTLVRLPLKVENDN